MPSTLVITWHSMLSFAVHPSLLGPGYGRGSYGYDAFKELGKPLRDCHLVASLGATASSDRTSPSDPAAAGSWARCPDGR